MYLFRLISTYLYKMETLGMGDVKLSTLIGFIVGTLDVFFCNIIWISYTNDDLYIIN